MAIVVNTIILAAGFFVMTTSAFKMSVDLGGRRIIKKIGALILDFLLLPALLLFGRNKEQPEIAGESKLLPSTA
jgi:predicted RND superfamily exporter protein